MRKGNWIQAASGKRLYPSDPLPEDFDVADIAAALSKVCRFGGHCLRFYSVAQHCVIMSRAWPEFGSWALLHDAVEMLTGDVPRPVKAEMTIRGVPFSEFEDAVLEAVGKRFGLVPFSDVARDIKRLDLVMLATERRDLMRPTQDLWSCLEGVKPLKRTIFPESSEYVERDFLNRAGELGML